MRTKILAILLVALFAVSVAAAPRVSKYSTSATAASVDNTTYINVNKILMFVTNHGNFGRDLAGVFGHDYGTYFPYSTVQAISSGADLRSPLYASGIWIGARTGSPEQTRIALSEYSSEFVPGPMLNNTFQTDRPEFRVYKLYSDSLADNPNDDYTNWPVNQGAPVNGDGTPQMIGDQMCWSVFNDADPGAHDNDAGETSPLGLEVRQTVFGFNREDALGNIVFVRLRIYNKGTNTLNNAYFSVWADPDLGGAGDDLVGCDTSLSLGYVYNATNDDSFYDKTPPCLGYDFFQGPMVAGTAADTAKMWGQLWPGMKNLGMVSFNKYINGTDPNDFGETYNYMQGKNADGTDYTYNGTPLLYYGSGDPVARTGDLDFSPSDRRMMQSTGPITFAPGDSTEILVAIIVGQGGDRLSSITVMKFLDQAAQAAYDADFDVLSPPQPPDVRVHDDEDVVSLYWTDRSEVNDGDFDFEGYTVYQGPSAAGPWTKVVNYDLNNGVGTIFDWVINQSTGQLEYVATKYGLDLGVQRFIEVNEDFLTGTRLYNGQDYYFRVEAYSYEPNPPTGVANTLTSATVVNVRPHKPAAGWEFEDPLDDIVTVNHPAGVSGGLVAPKVLDPFALTGHTYMVTFTVIGVDTVIDGVDTTFEDIIGWNLFDNTAGQQLVANQPYEPDGSERFPTIDGMQVKVTDPPPGFESFEVVANANGPIDPPTPGAFAFRDFPTPGGEDPDAAVQQATPLAGLGWGIHTGDDPTDPRPNYSNFIARVLRGDAARIAQVGIYDFEIRFTGSFDNPGVGGSWGWNAFVTTSYPIWVPFELWRTGIGTPNDPSDDVRLVPWILDNAEDTVFSLESWGADPDCGPGGCEHSASGGDNDPFTDWIYWRLPLDPSPGTAGYDAYETAMLADPAGYPGNEPAIMDRMVFVYWNGGSAPPFDVEVPEEGTVFRLRTGKPNTPADTFTFTTTPPTLSAKSEQALQQIKAVPNPFYLYGPYDPNPGTKEVRFQHLPPTCTIKIYNLSGDLVKTIEHTSADQYEAMAAWDGTTDNNIPVASGVYIYVVTAEGYGEFVGKLAVFTEVEVLRQF